MFFFQLKDYSGAVPILSNALGNEIVVSTLNLKVRALRVGLFAFPHIDRTWQAFDDEMRILVILMFNDDDLDNFNDFWLF